MALKSNGVTQVPDGLGSADQVLKVNSAGTAGEWGSIATTDNTKLPLAGGTISGNLNVSGSIAVSGSINIPRHSSNPSGAGEGDMYFNTSEAELRLYNGSVWSGAAYYYTSKCIWRI